MKAMKRWAAFLLLLSVLLSGCVIRVEVPTYETEPRQTQQQELAGDGLTVHFIDVGQADCILLECDGEYLLIDGGNRDDGQLVVSYLDQMGIEKLDTVVCTHAHEDHVGGLPSVLAVFPTDAVYCPTKTYSSRVFDDFMRYVDQQGLEVTLPVPGETISIGQAQATILGPVKSYADPNDTSIVLRIDYGETSFLFTGDMETIAENDMMDHWDNDELFHVDVLKLGHHGSSTSTSYRLLNAAQPTYGVIPVGKDNDYGHPHRETVTKLRQAGVISLRTDELGTIIARSDGSEISFTWDNQSVTPEDVEPGEAMVFIGNKNSKTFHSPDCGSLPSEKNRVEFDTYNEAVEAGYKACGSCLG